MAKKMIRGIEIKPSDFECEFKNCPIGLFLDGDELCLKTDYGGDAFICSSGEAYWGGTSDKRSRALKIVQPVETIINLDSKEE